MTPRKPLFVAGALLLMAAAPALAQQKIAPSRNYNAYDNTPKNRPDKSYGLPTFGTQGSELPQQRTMATKLPPTGGPSDTSHGSAEPDLGLSSGNSAAGAAPDMGASPDIGSASGSADQPDLDFFPKTDNSSLKLPGGPSLKPSDNAAASPAVKSGTGEMDTPLFDTPDGASSGSNESSGTED